MIFLCPTQRHLHCDMSPNTLFRTLGSHFWCAQSDFAFCVDRCTILFITLASHVQHRQKKRYHAEAKEHTITKREEALSQCLRRRLDRWTGKLVREHLYRLCHVEQNAEPKVL